MLSFQGFARRKFGAESAQELFLRLCAVKVRRTHPFFQNSFRLPEPSRRLSDVSAVIRPICVTLHFEPVIFAIVKRLEPVNPSLDVIVLVADQTGLWGKRLCPL